MNRRNALLGLGAIVTGGGAVFGSGAFSQVEADRTVSVNVAGDGSALLGLNPLNTTVASANDQLELDFSGGASGINYDAVTEFVDVFEIVNNGDATVNVHLTDNTDSNVDLVHDTTNDRFFYDTDGNQSGSGTDDTGTPDSYDPTFEFYASAGTVPAVGDASAFVGPGTTDTDGASFSLAAGASQKVSIRLDTRGTDSANVGTTTDMIQSVTVVASDS